MDVQMPVMDGYETARLIRMRSESEHTPIIFITAHAAEEAKIPIAYESGAVDFIFAPIVPDILRAKVRIFVELFLKSRALELTVRPDFRDSEARTRSVLDNVADGIVTVGDDGVIQSFNRAASELFGYTEQEAIGQPFSMIVRPKYPGDFASHAEANQQLLSPQPRGARAAEPVGRRKDGSMFPMELDLSDVELETGTIHIGCLRDISERQSYTEALQHQALHDNLTGLPNRVLFGDRVDARDPGGAADRRLARAAGHGPRRLQARQRHARAPARRRAAQARHRTARSTACATATRWRGSAATSSGSCRRRPPTWRAPRASSGRSSRRSSRPSSSTVTSST